MIDCCDYDERHPDEACRYAHDTRAPCTECGASVTMTPDHHEDGDGPWCAACSAVVCDDCWAANGDACSHCSNQ